MGNFEKLRSLYKPVQPSIKRTQDKVLYTEVTPSERLQNYIYCFWQLKSVVPFDSPFAYRVVSDGCIDIFFNNKNIADSSVMGFCKKYTEFSLGKSFDYIGVRFYPSVFTLLFKVSASELANKSTELKDALPTLANLLVEHINPNLELQGVDQQLNIMFEDLIQRKTLHIDHRFYDALSFIMEKSGVVEIEKQLQTGLSPRQLRRIFNYYIGATPKAFSRVVRFQHVLSASPSIRSLKKDKLFYDAGFFDQAHFIKDFKKFYGVTPSQAFG